MEKEMAGFGAETAAISAETGVKSNVADIFIDTSVNEVVGYDAKGKTLRFVETDGRIKELSLEVVQALGAKNRMAYTYAYGEMMFALQHQAPAPPPEVQVDPIDANARTKLKVRGGADKRLVWKARRNIEKFLQAGWRVCSSDEVKTYGRSTGPHRIRSTSEPGVDELVLMEMPKEPWKKWIKRPGGPKAISTARVEGFDKNSVERMRKAGGHPFLEEDVNARFTEMPKPEETNG